VWSGNGGCGGADGSVGIIMKEGVVTEAAGAGRGKVVSRDTGKASTRASSRR
jgi:hypothetical protein